MNALIVLFVLVLLISVSFFTIVLLFGSKDHSAYDFPRPITTGVRTCESDEHKRAVKSIIEDRSNTPRLHFRERLQRMREQMNERGAAFRVNADFRSVEFDGVKAEWVMAPRSNPNKRLLYIHGGAYMVGSPKSHRLITSRLSEVSNSAVLAVDYRLMPEHSRMAGVEDCRRAYVWLLENGPDGCSEAETLVVAGDSSGGNIVLSVVAWVRDSGLRAADAVVAFSPQTDLTLSSPSLRKNIDTDVMQGESFGPVVKAPKAFALLFSFLMHKINPSHPVVSPLLGGLSNLPPTLIQASETEMFLDDAVRYVNKAKASGSIAYLQTWPSMLHVWHAFQIPEADEAFEEIGVFLGEYA